MEADVYFLPDSVIPSTSDELNDLIRLADTVDVKISGMFKSSVMNIYLNGNKIKSLDWYKVTSK